MYRKGCEFSHGPYGLGQTHATMAITMELRKAARQSRANPKKIASIWIVLCNLGT